jgi:OFA family oxalate/formate antiporter-like MFS transporter
MELEHRTRRAAAAPPAALPHAASRWVIAGAGTTLQLCLGTVYAWSFFQSKIVAAYGWSHTLTAAAFSLAICSLGLAAAAGGVLLPRLGPRRLAVTGAAAYGAGHVIAAFALEADSAPLFLFGYGLVGGAGLGLGYVTPVATVAKWFPDRRGLATGLVVMGFGLGALLMSRLIASALLAGFGAMPDSGDLAAAYRHALPRVFLASGLALGALGAAAGWLLRDPPGAAAAAAPRVGEALAAMRSARFGALWIALFCNVAAGIMFIAFQAPLLEQLLAASRPGLSAAAVTAAGTLLIGASALANGAGRLVWGSLSDRIGRVRVLRLILATQIVAFALLLGTRDPWVFGALVCYVLLCYGGGFGTIPALVGAAFGARLMPMVYGALLTAWSLAGVAGPQIVAVLKDRDPAAAGTQAFVAAIALLSVGLAAALALREAPRR